MSIWHVKMSKSGCFCNLHQRYPYSEHRLIFEHRYSLELPNIVNTFLGLFAHKWFGIALPSDDHRHNWTFWPLKVWTLVFIISYIPKCSYMCWAGSSEVLSTSFRCQQLRITCLWIEYFRNCLCTVPATTCMRFVIFWCQTALLLWRVGLIRLSRIGNSKG